MDGRTLNRDLLPGNRCFGCGHENPHGLRIEVTDDGGDAGSLSARFEPPEHASGFPGLTHGGALFTAMDCLATWVVVLHGPRDGRYRLLGSADVSYRKGAPVGRPLRLVGQLVEPEESDGGDVVVVHVEVEDGAGQRVAEGDFHEVPVGPEKFRRIAGIEEIPEAWKDLFERPGGPAD